MSAKPLTDVRPAENYTRVKFHVEIRGKKETGEEGYIWTYGDIELAQGSTYIVLRFAWTGMRMYGLARGAVHGSECERGHAYVNARVNTITSIHIRQSIHTFAYIERNPDKLTKRDAALHVVTYSVIALQVVMQCNSSRTKYAVSRLSENRLTTTH